MEIVLKEQTGVGYGDLLLFERGNVLIISDYDGIGYRGLLLRDYEITEYYEEIDDLIGALEDYHNYGTLNRVIKTNRLKLEEM